MRIKSILILNKMHRIYLLPEDWFGMQWDTVWDGPPRDTVTVPWINDWESNNCWTVNWPEPSRETPANIIIHMIIRNKIE